MEHGKQTNSFSPDTFKHTYLLVEIFLFKELKPEVMNNITEDNWH